MTVISPYLYVQFLFVAFKKECMNLAWFRKVSVPYFLQKMFELCHNCELRSHYELSLYHHVTVMSQMFFI